MNSDVPDGSNFVVGIKQATKAVKDGMVKEAYVAKGVDSTLKNPFIKLCKKQAIQVNTVESSQILGKMCKIDVCASVAVVLK